MKFLKISYYFMISDVTSCIKLQKELQTAYPISLTWVIHIPDNIANADGMINYSQSLNC